MNGTMERLPASSTRAVAFRLRPDLVVRRLQFGSAGYWVLKDPLTIQHFHFREEEYALLKMLDGRASLEEIRECFERSYAPRRMNVELLQAFIAKTYGEGLLIADTPGQGQQWVQTRRQMQHRRRMQTVANVLAMRFRGIDPDAYLEKIYPWCRWMFSRTCVTLALLLVFSALVLVTLRWNDVVARLPEFKALFNAGNVLWLIVVLSVTKVLHELGHALTCKHFGGECHEMGLMFLVFTPCLYCDVSESWMLKSKWQRAAIAAAGIYVEVVMASIATWLWWLSQPGGLNLACLAVMVVCSVTTLVFNGNPLLRYDGYFILSDLLELPNLWQRSRAVIYHWAARLTMGFSPFADPWPDKRSRVMLAMFGIGSMMYRVVVFVGVLIFLRSLLRAQRLEFVGQLLVAFALFGFVVPPLATVWQLAGDPSMPRRFNRRRLVATGAIVTLIMGAILFLPLPCTIPAPLVLEPADAVPIYVSVAGNMAESVPIGTDVKAGEMIARLDNFALQREILSLAGELEVQQIRLNSYESHRAEDPEANARIPALRESIQDLKDRLAQRRRDVERLAIKAPVAGRVLAATSVPTLTRYTGKLPVWSGRPQDERNLGGFLETGTMLCWIGSEKKYEAAIYIDEADVKYVKPGQSVRLRVSAWPTTILSGQIEELSRMDVKVVPRELATMGGLAHKPDADGVARPTRTAYQARVKIESHGVPLLNHCPGEAKIRVAPQSLVYRFYRYLDRTFVFELK